MPRKVVAYACQYGCRANVLTNRQRMAKHEATCLLNPARHACPTCAHQQEDWDEPYTGHHYGEATFGRLSRVRYCDEDALPINKQCVVLCEKWEARGEFREDQNA